MNYNYINNKLHWDNTNLSEINQKILTKLKNDYSYEGSYYLYSQNIFQERINLLLENLPKCEFFYSVKSCSNINILKVLSQYEQVGVDVVSGGEILRATLAGFSGEKIVFAGVGKTDQEILLGLQHDIFSFHIESISELKNIAKLAFSINKVANVALRLNPNINVDTHEYIKTGQEENKFGISAHEIEKALEIISSSASLEIVGLQVHLGSLLFDEKPYLKALNFLKDIHLKYRNLIPKELEYYSLGGGLGFDYATSAQKSKVQNFPFSNLTKEIDFNSLPVKKLKFEPGRFISAPSGILITQVKYIKDKTNKKILITDSGMTELIRPALYSAFHPIEPLEIHDETKIQADIVGPICESADFFAKNVSMTNIKENDYLAVLHCGAYGSVMSSNYNSRLMIPEVLLTNNSFKIIRKPQTYEQLFSNEEVY